MHDFARALIADRALTNDTVEILDAGIRITAAGTGAENRESASEPSDHEPPRGGSSHQQMTEEPPVSPMCCDQPMAHTTTIPPGYYCIVNGSHVR